MKMKKILSLLLALCFLLGLLPGLVPGASAAGERTVSPWAAEEITRAEGYGLLDVGDLRADYAQWDSEEVTDWTQPITRAMFVRFALSYAAAMNHSDRSCFQNAVNRLISQRTEDGYFLVYPFSDDHSEEAAAAYALGIIQGRGGGVFDPDALITRQEAAAMLCRAYKACGGEATELGAAAPFADEEDISPWAAEAVHALRSRDVLRGMGDGTFEPQGNFTIQQCAVCFLRLYECMPVSFLKGNVTPVFTQEELISTIQPDDRIRRWDGPLRAGADAGVLAHFRPDAFQVQPTQLEAVVLGFRAVAPEAAQGAALGVDRGADAGPVVDGVGEIAHGYSRPFLPAAWQRSSSAVCFASAIWVRCWRRGAAGGRSISSC